MKTYCFIKIRYQIKYCKIIANYIFKLIKIRYEAWITFIIWIVFFIYMYLCFFQNVYFSPCGMFHISTVFRGGKCNNVNFLVFEIVCFPYTLTEAYGWGKVVVEFKGLWSSKMAMPDLYIGTFLFYSKTSR